MAKFSISSLFGKSKGRIFDPTRDSAKDALVALGAFKDILKAILVDATAMAKITPLKGFKNIKKVQEELGKAAKASNLLLDAEKKGVELKKDIIKEEDKRSKQRDKTLKQQAKINDQLQKEAGILGGLQKRIKDLKKQQLFAKTPQKLKEVTKELSKVQKEFRQLQRDGKKSTNTFGKALDSFGFKFNLLSDIVSNAAFAISNLFTQGISKVIDDLKGLSESISNVQKTTGLTEKEVGKLIETFKGLDTRTSIKSLLGIAEAAGRLNIAKEDIADFTEVVDKVFVSLGDELEGSAEDIATNLAKVSDVFGISAEFGVAEGINKLGSAINELGASTKAQSGFITDFTKRLVGVSEITNISATDILGLGTTLDELGQSVEVSGTAVSSILIKIAADSSKFARAAGIDVEKFKKLVNTDINEALIQFSKGVNDSSANTTELAGTLSGLGIDGARATNVVGALAGNVDKLRFNQELANAAFEKGTSLTDEFNIKNNNLAANYDKLIKLINNKFVSGGLVDFLNSAVKGVIRLNRAIQGLDKETESLVDSNLDVIKSSQTNVETNQRLVDTYEELSDKVDLTEQEQSTLDSTTNQLISTFGDSVVVIDKQTGALLVNIEVVKQKIITDQILQSEAARNLLVEERRLKNQIQNVARAQQVLDSFSDTGNFIAINLGKAASQGLGVLQKELATLQQEALSSGATLDEFNEKFETIIQAAFDVAGADVTIPIAEAELKKINIELEKLGLNLNDLADSSKDGFISGPDGDKILGRVDGLTGAIARQEKVVADLGEALKKTNKEGIEGIKNRLSFEEKELDNLKKLGDSTLLNDIKASDLKKELALQEEALKGTTVKKLKKLDEERLNNEISSLRERIDAVEETGEDELQLKKELNDKLLSLEQKRIDGEAKKREEDQKKRKEEQIAVLDALAAAEQKASDNRLDQFEKEREATIRRQDQLLEKANAGVLDAQESLTVERAKQLKIEQSQAREKERAELRSVAFAMISAFIGAGNDPKTSLIQTGILLKTVPILIDAVTPGFVEGTGSGTVASELGAPQRQGVDGYDIRVHGPEKIFKEDHANMIPDGMSNFEVATLAQEYGRGGTSTPPDDTRLLNEVKELNKTMRNKAELVDIIPDMVNGVLKTVTRRAGNIDTTNRKGGWVA